MVVLILAPAARSAFYSAACWGNSCIQLSRRESWCFHPSPSFAIDEAHHSCQGTLLENVFMGHSKLRDFGISTTAYYFKNGTLAGRAGWSVRSALEDLSSGNLAVCHTGHIVGQQFYSTCRQVVSDDDFHLSDGHSMECGQMHGYDKRVISEGCCGRPRADCPAPPEAAVKIWLPDLTGVFPWGLSAGRTELAVATLFTIAAVVIALFRA
jgi:hypothetical protein